MIVCDCCGRVIEPGIVQNGLPHGIGLEIEDIGLVNVCIKCVMTYDKVDEFVYRLRLKQGVKDGKEEQDG